MTSIDAMHDHDAARRRLARLEGKVQRLGEPAPLCLRCGFKSIESLLLVPFSSLPAWMRDRVLKNLLEWHHPLGRNVAPGLMVPLCRNCHAIASDRQCDLPPWALNPKTPTEQLEARLIGLEQWLTLMAEAARNARDYAGSIRAEIIGLLGLEREG